MSNCLFCKIINQEIPCYKVYEDDLVLAFLDIRPVNPGHTLIVPKEHCRNMSDASLKTLVALISAAQKISRAVIKATGAPGFNLAVNNEPAAGQVIFHLHFHLMPRFDGDGYKLWSGKEYEAGEAERIAEKIKELFV